MKNRLARKLEKLSTEVAAEKIGSDVYNEKELLAPSNPIEEAWAGLKLARAKLAALGALEQDVRARVLEHIDAIEEHVTAVETEQRIFSPDGVLAAHSNGERRKFLAEARDRMQAHQDLDAKLKNRLAKKLKHLEHKVQADETEDSILNSEELLGARTWQERSVLLADARTKLDLQFHKLDVKQQSRLVKKLSALEIMVCAETKPSDVDAAALAERPAPPAMLPSSTVLLTATAEAEAAKLPAEGTASVSAKAGVDRKEAEANSASATAKAEEDQNEVEFKKKQDYTETTLAISSAWELLKTPQEERDTRYVDTGNELPKVRAPSSTLVVSDQMLDAAKLYYSGLQEQMVGQIHKFVDGGLVELKEIWIKFRVPEKKQEVMLKNLIPDESQKYTSETNENLQKAAAKLRFQITSAGDVIDKIKEREEFILKWIGFEENATSPDRFKGSSMNLVKEEKFRKTALPKLIKKETVLTDALVAFESANSLKFSWRGDDDFTKSITTGIKFRPQPDVSGVSLNTIGYNVDE